MSGMSVIQTLLQRHADAGDVRALVQLAPQLKAPADRLLYVRLKMAFDLADARKTRAKSVQLFLGDAPGCDHCREKNHSVVPIDTPPEAIVPSACQCLSKGLCHILVSPWIKLPGQKPFIDR